VLLGIDLCFENNVKHIKMERTLKLRLELHLRILGLKGLTRHRFACQIFKFSPTYQISAIFGHRFGCAYITVTYNFTESQKITRRWLKLLKDNARICKIKVILGRSNKVEYNGRSLQYARTEDKCQRRFGQKPGKATALGRQIILEYNKKVILENNF
jgi:hypothetical protein